MILITGLVLVALSAMAMRWAMRRWEMMRDSASWPAAEGRLLRSSLPAARLFNAWRRLGFHPRLRAEYEVEGQVLHTRRISFGLPSKRDLRGVPTPLLAKEKITVFHDPESPDRSILLTGSMGEGILSTVFLVAAGGLALGACLMAFGALA